MFEMKDYDYFYEEVPKVIRDHRGGRDYSKREFLGSGGFGRWYLFTDFLTKIGMDVKIGDFGVGIKHENSVEKIMEACGTFTYLSPESLDGSGYSFGVDVWGLGVTLYVMVVGRDPFGNRINFLFYNRTLLCAYNIPSTVPLHTGDMIKSLFTCDPDCRPTIDDILKRDYLSSGSFLKGHLHKYVCGISLSNITEGFGFVGTGGYRVCTLMTFKCDDDSHENENIPEKEFKVDIEKS
uniref:Serine/threonine-protein kinase polo (inferred by orthology to a D. melanogaster protein) n=1 Tax=Strongyloides venezuelensis TaxID=75913 RepID=A0A0K0G278_STRVS